MATQPTISIRSDLYTKHGSSKRASSRNPVTRDRCLLRPLSYLNKIQIKVSSVCRQNLGKQILQDSSIHLLLQQISQPLSLQHSQHLYPRQFQHLCLQLYQLHNQRLSQQESHPKPSFAEEVMLKRTNFAEQDSLGLHLWMRYTK